MNSRPSRRSIVPFLLALALATPLLADETKPEPPPPATLAELEARIVEILEETKTPGAGVALFDRERTIWSAGVGLADVASSRKASADTLFRIGSVTKSMVSLAVLMVVEEGKLSLDDRVRELAPEIWFDNPWESTDPVRVVHLLEHTTGWDDLALKEYALSDPSVTLEQGLAYSPRSRASRWRPGTRHSYCNSGPAVAARIVEKIAGKPFEELVAERIFAPLGMASATFFEPAADVDSATLYHGDGTTPYAFWHVIMRPAGSVSASANEMARYGRLLAGRGRVDGPLGPITLLPASAIERSEHPATTWAARSDLRDGYGLGNYVAQADGFAWSGHDGGVEGGLARLAYLPEQGVGFALMINSGSGDALRKIAKAIRGFLVRELPKPQPAPAQAVDAATAERFSGWYLPDSPRQEVGRFVEVLLGPAKLSIEGESLVLKPLLGDAERYTAVSDRLFRQLGDKESVDEPIAGLALVDDPLEGVHIQSAMQTGRRISTWTAWTRIVIGGATLLLLLSAPVALLVHALLKLFRRLKDGGTPGLWLWPATPALATFGIVVLFMLCEEDLLQRLGNLTPWSGAFFALTLAIPLGTLLGLRAVFRSQRSANMASTAGSPASGASRAMRLWAWTLGAANLAATLYLGAYGILSLRTWV